MKGFILIVLAVAGVGAVQKVSGQDMMFAASVNYAAEVDAPADVVEFLLVANEDRLMNLEGGTIASKNAWSPKVKNYATKMMNDQAMMLGYIKKIALMRGLMLPDQISAPRKDDCDKLKGLSGKRFDRKFIQMMIDERKRDLEFFNDAMHSSDQEVRAFAEKYVVVAEEYLKGAKELKRQH